MKLLIGTTNAAKAHHFRTLLSDLPIELADLRDTHITEYPKETGKTFEENAVTKARFYAKKSSLPCIADDGGLEIDALGGAPGIYSRRWPFLKTGEDREATDEEMIAYALESVRGLPQEKRTAHMTVAVALVMPDGTVVQGKGSLTGYITEKPLGKPIKNFPFREILFIPEVNKYFGAFNDEELKRYDGRAYALQPIKVYLKTRI